MSGARQAESVAVLREVLAGVPDKWLTLKQLCGKSSGSMYSIKLNKVQQKKNIGDFFSNIKTLSFKVVLDFSEKF
jgi:hypothetical protein